MSILQEILDWTKGLPEWQSDAVARLLAKQTLTIEDQDDLFALLKAAHGIPDPKDRKPKPLTADQIPAPVKRQLTLSCEPSRACGTSTRLRRINVCPSAPLE